MTTTSVYPWLNEATQADWLRLKRIEAAAQLVLRLVDRGGLVNTPSGASFELFALRAAYDGLSLEGGRR